MDGEMIGGLWYVYPEGRPVAPQVSEKAQAILQRLGNQGI